MRAWRKTVFMAAAALAVCAQGAFADKLEVVCVYYPHWHRYPKGDEWFGAENWKEGEWTFVKTAKPRFPGHRQPLVPSTGHLDGASPEDVAKEIDLASDAGIDVFLYDYYWYDGKVTQEESLEKGFLKAWNRGRMKFALMWCYHERRDQFRPKLGEERRVLMSLAHTKDEFLGLIRYSVEHYFNKPEYWRKDGRLFFSIYDAPYFCSKRGNDAGRIKAELDEARGIVRAAGLGELHFNAQGAGPQLADFMADCGFDSLTDYNTSPYHMPAEMTSAMRARGVWEIDYKASFPTVRRRWQEMSSKKLPYIPNVTTGWDSTPRCRLDEPYPWRTLDYPYTMSFTNNTPEAFREILAEAKAHAENDPKKPGAVYINGWNEYTEGTYLIPNNFDSDGALRAIESVFGRGRDKGRDCIAPAGAPPQIRYVSSEGDDGNDGLSEGTPWRTLRKLCESLPAGGTGMLRRGDVFYGQLKPPAGPSPNAPTTIDAYGTGSAPVVCGYKIPKRDQGVWKNVGDKLWQIDLSDHSLFDGNHDTADGNVGFIWIDGHIFGQKSSYKKKQTPLSQWGFVDDYKCLTVWSEENPAVASMDIKIAVKMHLATPGSNTVIRNVSFRGTGSHGLNSMNPSHLRVSECSFLEIGGSYLEPKPEWGGTRYGNGVQLWRGGSDVVVTNCLFADIYDVAFTMQGANPVHSWENVSVVDCIMDYCNQCFEVWTSDCGPGIGYRNCVFRRNRCTDTGRGWAYDVRPDKASAAPILMYQMRTDVCDIRIEGNVFDNSRKYLVYKSSGVSALPDTFTIKGNTIVGSLESPVANRVGGAKSAEENKREAAIRAENAFRTP